MFKKAYFEDFFDFVNTRLQEQYVCFWEKLGNRSAKHGYYKKGLYFMRNTDGIM